MQSEMEVDPVSNVTVSTGQSTGAIAPLKLMYVLSGAEMHEVEPAAGA
jgi:hypothetical protein